MLNPSLNFTDQRSWSFHRVIEFAIDAIGKWFNRRVFSSGVSSFAFPSFDRLI